MNSFLLTLMTAVLNPGSVGQPRDYIPMASYAVIEMVPCLQTFGL